MRLTRKFRRYNTLSFLREFLIIFHILLYLDQSVWLSNILVSFARLLLAPMMSPLVFVSNIILLLSMTPPSEDSHQLSISSMPPQDTHLDSLTDQNSHHYLLPNILSVFSIIVVICAL